MKEAIIVFLIFALTSCLQDPKPSPDPKPAFESGGDIRNQGNAFSKLSEICNLQQTGKSDDVGILYNKLTEEQKLLLQQNIKDQYLAEENISSIFTESHDSCDVSNIASVIKLSGSDDLKKTAFYLISEAVARIEIKSLHIKNIECLKQLLDDSSHSSQLEQQALELFQAQYKKERENHQNIDNTNVKNKFKEFTSVFNLVDKFSEQDIKMIEEDRYINDAGYGSKPNPIQFSVLNVALEKDSVTLLEIDALKNKGANVLVYDKSGEDLLYPIIVAARRKRVDIIEKFISSYANKGGIEEVAVHVKRFLKKESFPQEVKSELLKLVDLADFSPYAQ